MTTIPVELRELLERVLECESLGLALDNADVESMRALLSEQPQASAAQSADAGPQAKEPGGGCANCRLVYDSQKGCVSIPCPAHQSSAAQSAPAGEREAFEAAWHSGAFRDSMFPERQPGMWDAFQAGAAWQRAQSAPVVPEGWKLVPVEPTEEMRSAFNKVDVVTYRQPNRALFKGKHSWSAMLAAAPTPGASDGNDVE